MHIDNLLTAKPIDIIILTLLFIYLFIYFFFFFLNNLSNFFPLLQVGLHTHQQSQWSTMAFHVVNWRKMTFVYLPHTMMPHLLMMCLKLCNRGRAFLPSLSCQEKVILEWFKFSFNFFQMMIFIPTPSPFSF